MSASGIEAPETRDASTPDGAQLIAGGETEEQRGWWHHLPRPLAYALGSVAVAAIALALAPPPAPPTDALYAPLGLAVLIGGLLSLRLRPNQPPTTLVLIPLLVTYVRFGGATVYPLALGAMLGSVVRGGRDTGIVAAVAHNVVSFVVASALVGLAEERGQVAAYVAFALGFTLCRFLLWQTGYRLGALAGGRTYLEGPDPLLPLVLAPLAALPLAAGARLGDGGLVLALAALLALLFVVREATNLATARAEVELERDRLARANALQDELLHLMTHQLKNPLTTVLARAQLAQIALNRGEAERVPAHLGHVEQSAKLIQRLVDNLLQLSQVEQSGSVPPSERVELAVLAEEVRSELQPLAEQKGVDLPAVLYPADQHLWVLAPPLLLREAISNLISNAIKYTPTGGTVSVAADASAGLVEVSVADTGIGMSEEDVARLFSKFFRGTNPRAREQAGTGLGLALTHAVVQRMGGTIRVASVLDQGSTFTLSLPRARA